MQVHFRYTSVMPCCRYHMRSLPRSVPPAFKSLVRARGVERAAAAGIWRRSAESTYGSEEAWSAVRVLAQVALAACGYLSFSLADDSHYASDVPAAMPAWRSRHCSSVTCTNLRRCERVSFHGQPRPFPSFTVAQWPCLPPRRSAKAHAQTRSHPPLGPLTTVRSDMYCPDLEWNAL
jgi:hypothetical protein